MIGQVSMDARRIEYGNIGNYYVVQGFFRELRRVFPEKDVEIFTTLQLTPVFCDQVKIVSVPLELYYDCGQVDAVQQSLREYSLSCNYAEGIETPFISLVMESDLVIDFSGDIWGSNANLLGKDRFVNGCLKNLIVKELGVPQVLMSSSPGPFDEEHKILAHLALQSFDIIINRESESRKVLASFFEPEDNRIVDGACPAFLYETNNYWDEEKVLSGFGSVPELPEGEVVGLILCGFNFETGPHDLWPRENSDYKVFVDLVRNIIDQFNVEILLFSHSNGFVMPPDAFQIQKGSDFKHAKKLYELVGRNYQGKVMLAEEILTPNDTFRLISKLDFLISGRIHGAVAGFVNATPTIVLDYGHPPAAHKLVGFVKEIGMDEMLVSPNNSIGLFDLFSSKWKERMLIKNRLRKNLLITQDKVRQSFDLLKPLLDSYNKPS